MTDTSEDLRFVTYLSPGIWQMFFEAIVDHVRRTGMDADEGFFDLVCCSGSRVNSIEAVILGEADAAAIDSNVLRVRLKEVPGLRQKLRGNESWGPFPIQPVVVRSALSKFGLQRFVRVTDEDYRCLWGETEGGDQERRSAILVATVSGRERWGWA